MAAAPSREFIPGATRPVLPMTTTSRMSLPLPWSCPACRTDLAATAHTAHCLTCHTTYTREGGIWRYLTPADAARVATFTHQYATIREAEGWRHDDDRYFRALPNVPDTDPHAAIWRQRARSLDQLLDRVVVLREATTAWPLTILDLGAGNCWLAHRLAERGHHIAAVDLLTNDWDGLGAYRRHDTDRIIPIQATFDRIPLADASADLAIFNASYHYSVNYIATLAEALRTLRPGGQLVILDSPLYHDPHSGARMVRERQAAFRQRHGFASDALGGLGYLTYAHLHELGTRLNIHWRILDVSSPMRRRLRRTLDRLRHRREAATMPLIIGYEARPDRRRSVLWSASPQTRFQPPSPPTIHRPRLIRAAARRIVRWRYLLFQRHRYDNLALERIDGTPIIVTPQVFNPVLLRTGALLAATLNANLIPPGSSVLDMGTGSGVGAIFAARWAGRVLAVDINPAAVRCARLNALMHAHEDRIEVREGDLFAPVGDERFDTILFNPPYFRGTPSAALDHAWRSTDVVERFAAALPDHLTTSGHALVILSTDGDTPSFLRAFAAHSLAATIIARRDYLNEVVTVYKLSVVSSQLSVAPGSSHRQPGTRPSG